MNAREKYIAELATHLGPLSQADRDDALEFYDEYIADAQLSTVAAIEDKLGTAKQLSHQILADYSIKSNEKSVANGHPASPHANCFLVGGTGDCQFTTALWGWNCCASTLNHGGSGRLWPSGRITWLFHWLSGKRRGHIVYRIECPWFSTIRGALLRGPRSQLNWSLSYLLAPAILDYSVAQPAGR